MEVTMAWTEITREQYRRDHLRYASDTSDAEWLILSFFLPAACHVGRPREVSLRAVLDAILYVLSTGCQWRALPPNFPPRSTVQYYFYLWRDQQLWRRINLARPQGGGTQRYPFSRRDRQPERQDHGKRRSTRV